MATVELVDNPLDGQQLHGAEIDNFMRAAGGFGVQETSISSTVTGADLNVTMPALTNVRTPNGSGGLVTVSPGGSAVGFSTNSGNFARTDILCVNDAGAYQVVEGTPTEETGTRVEAPMPALPTDAVMVAKVRFEASATVVAVANVFGRAIDVSDAVTVVSLDTDTTGAELTELADGSTTTLHVHARNLEMFFPVLRVVVATTTEVYQTATADLVLSQVSSADQIYVAGKVPDDFATLVELVLIVWPDATETVQYDLDSNYAAVGEVHTTHSEQALDQTKALTVNTLDELDVSGVFSSLAAGDVFGLRFSSDTNNIYAIGLSLKYTR